MMNSTLTKHSSGYAAPEAKSPGGAAPNHGPMAAEALVAMGCDDVVVAWADRYRRQLDAIPPPRSPVTAENWAQALGAIDRFGDWVAFFRAQLAEAPWQVVFGEWIGRLLPATPSAGAHGLIRTAHALRALADAETSLRVEELGVALAYWAAYYRKLPGTPRLTGTLDLGDALLRIPLFLSGQARPGMPRQVYLRVMQAHGGEFSQAVDGAAEPESVEDALSSLTEAGARMYLANAARQPLVLLHTVTAPAALRLMLPHLPAGLHKTALAYVWQNVAATAAAYGDQTPSVSAMIGQHRSRPPSLNAPSRPTILTRSSSPRPASGSIGEILSRSTWPPQRTGHRDCIAPGGGAPPNAMPPAWSSVERLREVWTPRVKTPMFRSPTGV